MFCTSFKIQDNILDNIYSGCLILFILVVYLLKSCLSLILLATSGHCFLFLTKQEDHNEVDRQLIQIPFTNYKLSFWHTQRPRQSRGTRQRSTNRTPAPAHNMIFYLLYLSICLILEIANRQDDSHEGVSIFLSFTVYVES